MNPNSLTDKAKDRLATYALSHDIKKENMKQWLENLHIIDAVNILARSG